jgi:hypothetical protein
MEVNFVALCSFWHLLPVIILPVLFGPINICLLASFRAATEENYQLLADLPTIDAVAWAGILENQFDDAFTHVIPLPL